MIKKVFRIKLNNKFGNTISIGALLVHLSLCRIAISVHISKIGKFKHIIIFDDSIIFFLILPYKAGHPSGRNLSF